MPPSVLYCCDPLNPRRVDEHFAREAHEVRARAGGVALIDHDALLNGDAKRAVARVPTGFGPVWYRGWMIPSDRYRALAHALHERGVGLIVSPERYQAAHELPGWYRAFAELTPASAWAGSTAQQDPDEETLGALAGRLRPGPGIVKDFVKSRKHEWDEACFIPDLSDAAAVGRVVRRFVELQGEYLAGGIVLREFEHFVTPESGRAEVRVWWVDGEAGLRTPHPDSPQHVQTRIHVHEQSLLPGLDRVSRAVRLLGCRFVTTDLALRSDGEWRVVEVGDGQVSDLHPETDASELVGLLPTG